MRPRDLPPEAPTSLLPIRQCSSLKRGHTQRGCVTDPSGVEIRRGPFHTGGKGLLTQQLDDVCATTIARAKQVGLEAELPTAHVSIRGYEPVLYRLPHDGASSRLLLAATGWSYRVVALKQRPVPRHRLGCVWTRLVCSLRDRELDLRIVSAFARRKRVGEEGGERMWQARGAHGTGRSEQRGDPRRISG